MSIKHVKNSSPDKLYDEYYRMFVNMRTWLNTADKDIDDVVRETGPGERLLIHTVKSDEKYRDKVDPVKKDEMREEKKLRPTMDNHWVDVWLAHKKQVNAVGDYKKLAHRHAG